PRADNLPPPHLFSHRPSPHHYPHPFPTRRSSDLYSREHGDHAPALVRDDREHVALGNDPPLAGDDLHHAAPGRRAAPLRRRDARSEDTRLNSSHVKISYAVFCLKKKKKK